MVTTGDRAEGWFTCHDPEFRELIPGHQLIEYLIDHHDELGVTFIDEMIGASPYKLDWQTGGYRVGTMRAVPIRPGGKGRGCARARLRVPTMHPGKRSCKRKYMNELSAGRKGVRAIENGCYQP